MSQKPSSNNYEDLVGLFKEFREFHKPKVTRGVPDYTPAGMEERSRGLKDLQKRLAAIDPGKWPISRRVDYHLVRAEMNGVDFDHRVLRPWARDPAFYSVLSRFEHTQCGAMHIPRLPVPDDSIAEFRTKLQAVGEILSQAKENLTEAAADLVLLGARVKKRESGAFRKLITGLTEHHPDLVADAERALAAIDDFSEWLEENKSRMAAPAGVGIENYNWCLRNVYLFPYTWDEVRVIVDREYQRSVAFLKLEEKRNSNLPALEPAATEAEYRGRFNEAARHLMDFLREKDIFTIPDYMKPRYMETEGPGLDKPRGGVRNFFQQCLDRDPLPLRPHDFVGHGPDGQRVKRDDRPIRGLWHLGFVDCIRSEGLATGAEEMLMHAGLLDERPRSRELTYILLAFRAARAAADLKMHSNELTFTEAIRYCAEWTPYGWLREDGFLAWDDLELYLRQPGYGMGYLMGKVRLEQLLADRARQLGRKFDLREFMDEFLAAGMIPMALARWEMTGLDDEIKKLW